MAESGQSNLSRFLELGVRSWEKWTFSSIRLNNFRIAQNQPLALSGEWPLLPNTSHSDANIQSDLNGRF
jgi:hypothetical protein